MTNPQEAALVACDPAGDCPGHFASCEHVEGFIACDSCITERAQNGPRYCWLTGVDNEGRIMSADQAAFVTCGTCAGRIEWLDPGNDHGGYWAHEAHPDDGHEAVPDHGDHYEADDV